MGILYNSVMAHQEMKRNFVIERLLEAGVSHSADGISIHKLSYDELKSMLVLQAFKEIDAEKDANKWF